MMLTSTTVVCWLLASLCLAPSHSRGGVWGFSTTVPTSATFARGKHPESTAAAAAATPNVVEFWSQPRSVAQIESHVMACLNGLSHCFGSIDELQATTTTTTTTVEVVSAEPPLVIIHNFLSQPMCRDVIETAVNQGLQRSTTGESNRKTTSRTSSTVWLRDEDHSGCTQALRLIADKVSAVSGLPPEFMENLQVCRYLPGQEFKLHTDHQESFNELECRGRLATCLLYLSEPEEGGETWFPGLVADPNDESTEPKIAPRQGSAVFFWNTVERPGAPGYDPLGVLNVEMQLRHAGLPVLAGEKFIANRWVHPIDIGSGVRGTRISAQQAVV